MIVDMFIKKFLTKHVLSMNWLTDLPNRITYYEILQNKAFTNANNPQHNGHKVVLLQWFKNVLIKKLLNIML